MTYFCSMAKHISSIQNSSVKRLLLLQNKSRTRKKEGGFIIEGQREIQLAIAGGYLITEVYYCQDMITYDEISTFLDPLSPQYFTVSQEVYKKIAYRSGTEGVVAFAKAKQYSLTELHLPETPLILVAEAPEKPGNIGAMLRTADAAGVDAVIIANPKTDLYNPNIIRSSVGCVFTTQIAMASTKEVVTYLNNMNLKIYSAILQEAKDYHSQDFKEGCAIVVGAEATGLSETWRSAGVNIKIPMRGKIDSMNVSVAAGILIFEAQRQRST